MLLNDELLFVNPPPHHLRPTGALGETAAFTGLIELDGAAVGDMRLLFRPIRNVEVHITYNYLARTTDALWRYLSTWIQLLDGVPLVAQNDADGENIGPWFRWTLHSSLNWKTMHTSATFKLVANQTYTARCLMQPGIGTWVFYQSPSYTSANWSVAGLW